MPRNSCLAIQWDAKEIKALDKLPCYGRTSAEDENHYKGKYNS